MELRYSIVICFLFSCFFLQAQDTLYRTSGEKIIVKVTEVGPSQIKYKRVESINGPEYVIKSSEVSKIIYADGHNDIFIQGKMNTSSSRKTPPPFHSDNGLKRRHFIGINMIDLLPGLLTFNYEANIYQDLLSVRIPISFGVSSIGGVTPRYGYDRPDFFYYNRDKKFSTGFDLRYYPYGQNRISYFIGLAYEYGVVRYTRQGIYPQPPSPPYDNLSQEVSYSSLGIVNGFQIQATDHLCMSTYLTAGSQLIFLPENNSDYIAMFRCGFVIGWRFGTKTSKVEARKNR